MSIGINYYIHVSLCVKLAVSISSYQQRYRESAGLYYCNFHIHKQYTVEVDFFAIIAYE